MERLVDERKVMRPLSSLGSKESMSKSKEEGDSEKVVSMETDVCVEPEKLN